MLTDVDYHIHTFYSDGDLSPEQIVDRYLARGYEQIAITDHDELEGSMVAFAYSYGKGITVLPGIELSTRDHHDNTVHILGYNINYSDPELLSTLRMLKLERAKRNDRLLKVLCEMGYEISVDDLVSINEGRYIGKPTFARVLVNKGYADDVDSVFKGIFRDERIRPLRKKTLDTSEAIRLIHEAGGTAVFAHPVEVRKRDEDRDEFYKRLRELIDEMIEFNIDGIECYHPSASLIEAEMLRDVARLNNLVITKGSDFHSDLERRDYEG